MIPLAVVKRAANKSPNFLLGFFLFLFWAMKIRTFIFALNRLSTAVFLLKRP